MTKPRWGRPPGYLLGPRDPHVSIKWDEEAGELERDTCMLALKTEEGPADRRSHKRRETDSPLVPWRGGSRWSTGGGPEKPERANQGCERLSVVISHSSRGHLGRSTSVMTNVCHPSVGRHRNGVPRRIWSDLHLGQCSLNPETLPSPH